VSEVQPSTFEQAAEALAAAAEAGDAVRIVGGGTKLAWGTPPAAPELTLRTTGLNRIVEHNVGDLTAVLQAGVPFAAAQERFAGEGQMFALDPALGLDGAQDATIGGVIATADSGPLRHRYGAPRDLVVGMTVALSDGTIARSGGKVIKNVAGYDIAKLFAGAFGTLGLILEVTVRLHPLQATSATAFGSASDPDVLAAAGRALAGAPLELESLDIAWREGHGELLARGGGVQAQPRAERVAAIMRDAGLQEAEITTDDEPLWARQRAGQRSSSRALLRLAARPTALPKLLRAVDASDGALVGRVALGTSYVELDPDAVASFRERLPSGVVSVVLDGSAEDPWGPPPPIAAGELMQRIKARFDPAFVCNPGVFVGGI
jgi:glycolate oxidase FAD binding subunit